MASQAKCFAESTMSTVSFIFKYLNNAPVIEKNIDYKKQLQLNPNNKHLLKDDEKIVEDILSYKRHNTLVKYLGEIIISIYKKDNPNEQSLWNSDSTRKNYLLRELVNKTAYRKAEHKHYVEVPKEGCITLLFTSKPFRKWGFYINGKLWRPLRYFSKYGHPICSDQ